LPLALSAQRINLLNQHKAIKDLVPEPSTILLLGSGLFGVDWYGQKRKKA
jgi:hypothetical protein